MSYRRTPPDSPYFILRKGTVREKGEGGPVSGVIVARGLANFMRSALGPGGASKLLVTELKDIVVTRDGARMLSSMSFSHPMAWILQDAAKSVEMSVGDGTKIAVILIGEIAKRLSSLVNPKRKTQICRLIHESRFAYELALKRLRELASPFNFGHPETMKKIAMNILRARGIEVAVDHLAELVVRAVLKVGKTIGNTVYINPDDVQILKQNIGSLYDSELILGAVIDRSSDRGIMHLLMPKSVRNVRVALIDTAIKPTDKFVRMRIYKREIIFHSPEHMKSILNEHNEMAVEMARKLISIGAGAVFSRRPIHELTAYELAKAGIPAVERLVSRKRIHLVAKATGARPVVKLSDLREEDLGWAEVVEERRIGNYQVIVVEGGERSQVATIILRSSSEKLLDEVEHALKDIVTAFSVLAKTPAYVPGGGAIEEAISFYLTKEAEKHEGWRQMAIYAFASALEQIPISLAINSGMDPADALTELRSKHANSLHHYGIDMYSRRVADMYEAGIIDPLPVKEQILKTAYEIAALILRIDEIIDRRSAKRYAEDHVREIREKKYEIKIPD